MAPHSDARRTHALVAPLVERVHGYPEKGGDLLRHEHPVKRQVRPGVVAIGSRCHGADDERPDLADALTVNLTNPLQGQLPAPPPATPGNRKFRHFKSLPRQISVL